MSHTEGPWSVQSAFIGPLLITAGGKVIAHVGDDEFRQCAANAELIAAAPNLLEAAERALELIENGAPGWGVAKDLLRAAIHQARGAA